MATATVERYEFGRNWQRFLGGVDENRLEEARLSLQQWFGRDSFEGLRFADVGCGSGIFSLAAQRLGASVHSFDYDPDSVAATFKVKSRFASEATTWSIERGSVLDSEYLERLGEFDLVYSWGVLHHTGDLWKALDLVSSLVRPGGALMMSLYNDGGRSAEVWGYVKRLYVTRPFLRPLLAAAGFVRIWGPPFLRDLLRGRPLQTWREYGLRGTGGRGMSAWTDFLDWMGGYPYEASKAGDVVMHMRTRGLRLEKLSTVTGSRGCNEFLFTRANEDARGKPVV